MTRAECARCCASERDYRVRGHHGIFCMRCGASWDAPPPARGEMPPVYVRPEQVKIQEFRGHYVEVMRVHELAASWRPWNAEEPPPVMKAERCILQAQRVVVAESSFNMAYDPETGTLFISDAVDGGYLLYQARREAEMGRPLPFQREVDRAEANASEAWRHAERVRADSDRRAKLVAKATDGLRSRKSGVRRRAKRLLEKLGGAT